MIKRVGIIGLGVVGKALTTALTNLGHTVFGHDPNQGLYASRRQFDDAELIFVCVPTPVDNPLGLVNAVLGELFFLGTAAGKPVVLRSTVPPGSTDALQLRYPELQLLCSPEFLTEASAFFDEASPVRQIVGWTKSSYQHADMVLDVLPRPSHYRAAVRAIDAEAIKYFSNTFYATKVAFANQFYDYCQDIRANWDEVYKASMEDPLIAPCHMDVFHAGYRGFGGKCLPKDVKTILGWSPGATRILSILAEALAYNERLSDAEIVHDHPGPRDGWIDSIHNRLGQDGASTLPQGTPTIPDNDDGSSNAGGVRPAGDVRAAED